MFHRFTQPARRRAWCAAALLCCAAFASACSPAPDDPAAVTADEDRQLNEAAAQLDAEANLALPPVNESSVP